MDEKGLLPCYAPEALSGSPLCNLRPLRPGDPCPDCGQTKLDYNGLLELECLICGYRNSGGAGCT
ncbi:MAG: hypothetical protein JXB85_09735 [Anaerolineales bacterium]|nr:hypothetical protein [Anaerolineales bacterium]